MSGDIFLIVSKTHENSKIQQCINPAKNYCLIQTTALGDMIPNNN